MTYENIKDEIDELAKRTYVLSNRVDLSPSDVACMQFEIVIMMSILVERLLAGGHRG